MRVDVISCEDTSLWNNSIASCVASDFYHTAEYHQLHEDGKGALFVFSDKDKVIALPLLIRSLSQLPTISDKLGDYYDATSVYGYSGPLTNLKETDHKFIQKFNDTLLEVCTDLKIIAVFSRLHPVLQNQQWISAGEITCVGTTIAIDLTQPNEDQFRNYRKSHRNEIRKAYSSNVKVLHDTNWEYYSEFLHLYTETMQRVDADENYYFDENYFNKLRNKLNTTLNLFVALLDDQVLSAGLFTLYDGIIQYHLSGSSNKYMNFAASKIIIDHVRLWGNSIQAKKFHLGGGVGAGQDSLFAFKSGFSKMQLPFYIWKWIVDPQRYNVAVQAHSAKRILQGRNFSNSTYFPSYRVE